MSPLSVAVAPRGATPPPPTSPVGDQAGAAHRRSRWRRWRPKILVAGAVAFGLAVLIAVALAQSAPPSPLEPTSADKTGARALVEVLGDHGVDVQVVRTLTDAQRAVRVASGPTTVVIADPTNLPPPALDWLLKDVYRDLDRLVVLDPSQEALDLADLPVQSLVGQAPLGRPRCDSPLIESGDEVSTWTTSRFVAADDQQATLCFPLDSGEGPPEDWSHGAGLAITHAPDAPDIEVVLVGFGASWSNQEIADDAHAGIAIRALGSTPSLIWYQPGLSDAADYADSAGSGWPGWVGPVSSLIAAAFVLFALAIGRRLGPPVAEPLPVLVPAAEITTSRGRMYLRTNDRGRSARILQDASKRRLAARLGVPRGASGDQLVAAVAGATGLMPAGVAELLFGPPPPDDAALIDLAQQLTNLEERVRA